MIGTFDDFGFEMRQDFGERLGKKRPLIGAVGEQLLQERKQTLSARSEMPPSLNAGGMHHGVKQQTQRIYEMRRFLPSIFLPASCHADRCGPLSALFTLWRWIIAAVVLASRSAFSRHAT
jgi:hypothetical protein